MTLPYQETLVLFDNRMMLYHDNLPYEKDIRAFGLTKINEVLPILEKINSIQIKENVRLIENIKAEISQSNPSDDKIRPLLNDVSNLISDSERIIKGL